MENLRESVHAAMSELKTRLVESKPFRRELRQIGIHGASGEDVVKETAKEFENIFIHETNELFEENEVAAKLDLLKELIEKGDKSEASYRPTGDPVVDAEGHIGTVYKDYLDALEETSREFDKSLSMKREELKAILAEFEECKETLDRRLESVV